MKVVGSTLGQSRQKERGNQKQQCEGVLSLPLKAAQTSSAITSYEQKKKNVQIISSIFSLIIKGKKGGNGGRKW